jgi:hypothetical protein
MLDLSRSHYRFIKRRCGGWFRNWFHLRCSVLRQPRKKGNTFPRTAGRGEMEICSRDAHCARGLQHHQRTTTKREAKRRKAHYALAASVDTAAGVIGTRSPSGASRRRLSQRANAATQPRPCFARSRGHGRYPRRQSRLSGAPRAPVVMPAGPMPGPPGSGVTSPARRNRTRPINRLSPVDDPSMSEIR